MYSSVLQYLKDNNNNCWIANYSNKKTTILHNYYVTENSIVPVAFPQNTHPIESKTT